ncbi:uncharacterized protein LOC126934420 [Macaca thibetana thibetana]|uniref:uncharacterized protein LOC126934420 n=1 Tax=Macaca thibetana thibetana TaxID=257877 RepID=UPI0021BC8624|nr:uncharacterized protein LOC126934420 [Macaca thibetana thibetana]
MAGASAARRRAPLIGCPPTPLPGPAGPLPLPLPLSGGRALPPSHASSSSRSPPPRARRTEPALPPSRGSGPGTAGALRKGWGAPSKQRESRCPGRSLAPWPRRPAWEPGGRGACTFGARLEFEEWRGPQKLRAGAMAAASGGYLPDRTPGKGSKGMEPPHTG